MRLNNTIEVNKSVARVEVFSDGVFAIAITLLILGIKVPPIDSIHSASDLSHALVHLWPSFFAFFYSFGSILIQWVFHHNIFSLLNKTSRVFLYINGFLLLNVVFFPFPTALLAEYINTEYATPAVVFYGIVCVLKALSWRLLYHFIDKPILLRTSNFSDELLNKIKRSNSLTLIIYISTTLLAIWLPHIALIINISVWAIWIYLSLIEKAKDQ